MGARLTTDAPERQALLDRRNEGAVETGIDQGRTGAEGPVEWDENEVSTDEEPTEPVPPNRVCGIMSPPFRVSSHGVERLIDHEDRNSGEVTREWTWFCSWLTIVAVTRDADGCEWGRLVEVIDPDDKPHRWAMPMEMLAGSGEEYRRRLLSMGLTIAPGPKPRNWLHEYLTTYRPDGKARCVPRIGWHGSAFVLPDGTIGEAHGEDVLLQAVGDGDFALGQDGTLEDWQNQIARIADGNSRLVMSLSAAFAAPLLHLVNAESGGVHLRGPSSIGKSTALEVAGSVWGGGGVKGYVRQWRTTDNALEAVATAHCDLLLCLDELSQVDSRAAGNVAYMLANGQGKARATRTGDGRKPKQWRVLFLSSGEISLADKIGEDGRGRRPTAGQEVRVIDIPADAGSGLGLFEALHDFASPPLLAQHLKTAVRRTYGTAGRAFLEYLVCKDLKTVADIVRGCQADFVKEVCLSGADGQVVRVAERFGLIAAGGECAIRSGILPMSKHSAFDAAKTCFDAWLAARGGSGAKEISTGIDQVRRFIEQHGESRFTLWSNEFDANAHITHNRAGFRKSAEDGGCEYFVLPEAWRSEICTGLDAGMVAREMARLGMVKTGKDGKPQVPIRLPGFGKTIRCYIVTPDLFGESDDA